MTPKWLGLLAIVVLIVIAFIKLGEWQLGVARGEAQREAVERARSTPAAELTTVLAPGDRFKGDLSSRPVTATGAYAATGQFLVPARRLEDRKGYWLVAPFVVEATGVALPVLRGFTTDPTVVDTPSPTGQRTIRGGLAPGESPVSGPTPLPSGQRGSIDIAALVNAHFDLRPRGIVQMLDLLRPIYLKTAAYGHFGRDEPEFTWEATDRAEALRAAAGI